MKTIQNMGLAAVMILSLLATACSGDDDATTATDDDTDTAAGAEFVTAKVDGANFAAAQEPAVIVGATIDSGVLAVQGGTNDGETIRVTVVGYDGPGTYTTGDNPTNGSMLMYLTLTPTATWMNSGITALVDGIGTGTVVVSSDSDGVVEGTFSFTGYNAEDMSTKEVTEGKFKANLDN